MNSRQLGKLSGKRRRTKEKVSILLESFFIDESLYISAIQGHSGRNLVDPSLQDNILLPDDFTEYIFHIRNAFEMHSILQSGLIPGGRSNRKDRQSVFCTAVNPMDVQLHQAEVEYDLTNPESHRTNIFGSVTTIQYSDEI